MDERRRQQLQEQEEIIDFDVDLLQEREERIRQLEVGTESRKK